MTRAAGERFAQALGKPFEPALLADSLFTLSANGHLVNETAHQVRFNTQGELEIDLAWSHVPAGDWQLDATHLRHLPEGYLNTVSLRKADGTAMAHKLLHAGDSAIGTHVPKVEHVSAPDPDRPANGYRAALAALIVSSTLAALWLLTSSKQNRQRN
ncbi:MAG: hypothetical protein ACOY0T_30510 [Myxococcota bacterium]